MLEAGEMRKGTKRETQNTRRHYSLSFSQINDEEPSLLAINPNIGV